MRNWAYLKKSGTKTVLFLLGWFAGGDRHSFEVMLRLNNSRFSVYNILPQRVYQFIKKSWGRNVNNSTFYNIKEPLNLEAFTRYNILAYLLYFLRAFVFVLKLRKGFDVIYCSGHQLELLLSATLAKVKNPHAKLIVWVHHLIPTTGEREKYGKNLRSSTRFLDILSYVSQEISLFLIKRYGDLVFTPTHHMRQMVAERGIPASKIIQVDNGLDLEFIYNTSASSKKFDACAFVTIAKSIDVLRVWSIVAKERENSRLALIGRVKNNRKAFQRLKEMIDALKITENLMFCGLVDEREKFAILKSSRVFISDTYEEGWSLSISEACACGLPVVAYDCDVFREIYEGCILLVPRGDMEKLAGAVLSFLRDPEIASRYAKKALEWACRYNWDKIAEKEESIILELLSKHKDFGMLKATQA